MKNRRRCLCFLGRFGEESGPNWGSSIFFLRAHITIWGITPQLMISCIKFRNPGLTLQYNKIPAKNLQSYISRTALFRRGAKSSPAHRTLEVRLVRRVMLHSMHPVSRTKHFDNCTQLDNCQICVWQSPEFGSNGDFGGITKPLSTTCPAMT